MAHCSAVLREKRGDKCGTHIYHDSLGLISLGRLACPPWPLKRWQLSDEQAKQAEMSFSALPRLRAVHLAGSQGLGSSQGTNLTCLLVPGHTGVAESLSRLQIKALMTCNPTTDPLRFSVSSWGASCLGQPSKPLRSEEEISVTVSHGLDADTVGAPGGSTRAPDHGREPGHYKDESAGTWAWT